VHNTRSWWFIHSANNQRATLSLFDEPLPPLNTLYLFGLKSGWNTRGIERAIININNTIANGIYQMVLYLTMSLKQQRNRRRPSKITCNKLLRGAQTRKPQETSEVTLGNQSSEYYAGNDIAEGSLCIGTERE
jgi:hypothetical protein